MNNELRYTASITDYREHGTITLPDNPGKYPVPVFLSLHVLEEYDENYTEDVKKVCEILRNKNYDIIADISEKTLHQFSIQNFEDLKEKLGVWTFRIEDGLQRNTIYRLAQKMPIVLNASTLTDDDAKVLSSASAQIYAMFSSYPHPETGLDDAYLRKQVQMLHKYDIRCMAFIPGDKEKMGPIKDGLPTLEAHRYVKPSVAFIDLISNFGIDSVFVGDNGVSDKELSIIDKFGKKKVVEIPTDLNTEFEDLYDREFTARKDSPAAFIRFKETRTDDSSWSGIQPDEPKDERPRGAITVDNDDFKRYSGEVHLMRKDMPNDERVNVIGKVKPEYDRLIDCVQRGGRFTLVR